MQLVFTELANPGALESRYVSVTVILPISNSFMEVYLPILGCVLPEELVGRNDVK